MTKLPRRHSPAFAVLAAAVLATAAFAGPVLPEYQAGDVAAEDIISPVTLRVVDPELSAALRQESAAGVPLIFRHVVTDADEAEGELRACIDTARSSFLAALRQALLGRIPVAGDVESPAYGATVRAATLAGTNPLPLARLAPLWVRGVSDAPVIDALVQPLREVMAQPIVNDTEGEPLSVDQPIRIIRVRSALEAPGLQVLENPGLTTLAAHLSSVESARSVTESYFPSEQQDLARFVAGFLRANTFAAPGLTELLRSKRRDAALGYDTYVAGQVIVKKGQAMDRKALAALAALRDKHLIEALLTKVEAPATVAVPAIVAPREFLPWFGAAGLVVLLLLWLWGGRSAAIAAPAEPRPVVMSPALRPEAAAEIWRNRALLAEQRADRAHAAIRQGALGWMREKLFKSLFQQRAALLSTQQMAEAEMVALEQRMAQLLVPLQERIKTYETRIRELEETLADQEGDTRRLIDARISRARQQLELERARAEREF